MDNCQIDSRPKKNQLQKALGYEIKSPRCLIAKFEIECFLEVLFTCLKLYSDCLSTLGARTAWKEKGDIRPLG